MAKLIKNYRFETFLAIIGLGFSVWLMWSTFSYKDGSMLIASKAWSDFASHIPLIRSFSLGDNFFQLEYPLFPGEPMRYHFLFYTLVGFLEKAGLRIDYAINFPSSIGFFALLVAIYLLAKFLFKSRVVSVFSVLFFLFNGSMSFFEFFKTPSNLFNLSAFPSFGPYDGKIVSAFWSLNIYTNQRHFAFSLAILLFLVFYFLKTKKPTRLYLVSAGLTIGMLLFLHSAVFIMAVIVLSCFLLFLPKKRRAIAAALLIGVGLALPRLVFLREGTSSFPVFSPGYLISDNLNLSNLFQYWFYNFGLALFLVPLGVFLVPRTSKIVFFSFLPLFALGNLFQFSPEMAGNHKFFNVFLIVSNIFAAYALLFIWKQKFFGKVATLLCFFFLVLSGVIDFFPVKNDRFLKLDDYPKDPGVTWIIENTPKDAVFLNSSYLYHPASIAGRKIFLGWPYFSWSLGYDTQNRDILRKKLLSENSLDSFCSLAAPYDISYVFVEKQGLTDDYQVNSEFFAKNFPLLYAAGDNSFLIYDVKSVCLK